MASKFFSFFGESRQELARVNWPGRDELIQSTTLVIVVTMLMAVFVWAVDLLLTFLVRIVLK